MLRPSTVLTDCPRRLQRGEEDEEDVGAVDGHPGMAGMGGEAPHGGGRGRGRRDHRDDGMTPSFLIRRGWQARRRQLRPIRIIVRPGMGKDFFMVMKSSTHHISRQSRGE